MSSGTSTHESARIHAQARTHLLGSLSGPACTAENKEFEPQQKWPRAGAPAPDGGARSPRAARRLPQPWRQHHPPASGGGEEKRRLQVDGAAFATPARWARGSLGQGKPPVLERRCSLKTRALKFKTQLCAQLCEQEARKRAPHSREDPPRGVALVTKSVLDRSPAPTSEQQPARALRATRPIVKILPRISVQSKDTRKSGRT